MSHHCNRYITHPQINQITTWTSVIPHIGINLLIWEEEQELYTCLMSSSYKAKYQMINDSRKL